MFITAVRKLLICLFLTCTFNFMCAQTIEDRIDNLRNPIPPSPNASSLAKYGEWPVDLYTGVPDISVPVFDLKGKGVSVPIAINYHSSGIKVGDIASWVGLGWSLNAGGVITRGIKGLPDETPISGFFEKRQLYTNQNDLCSPPVNLALATEHKVQSAKGISDSEQDAYTVNALGQSFRFVFKSDGSIVTAPYTNVKIITNFGTAVTSPENVYWNVILENGTKLEFGGNGFVELTSSTRLDIGASYVPTSWMLKSITSPEGEIVTFSYSSSLISQDSYFSQSDYIKNTFIGYGDCYIEHNNVTRSKAEMQQVVMLQLTSIETPVARVEFEQSSQEREDLKGAKSLSLIKVYSKISNSYIQKTRFVYQYSQAAASNEYWVGVTDVDKPYYKRRLKLTDIEVLDPATSAVNNKWHFNYNPQLLPSRRSYAQDHWGFYNGLVSNTTLLPKHYYLFPSTCDAGFGPPFHNIGVSREGNGTYAQAEILQEIEYPTGGKTTFHYEPNTINVNEEVFNSSTSVAQLNLNANSIPYSTTQEQSFTITKGQRVKMSFVSYISPAIFNDMPGAKVTVTVYKSGTSTIIAGASNLTGISQTNEVKYFNLIQPGVYVVKVSTNIQQSSLYEQDIIQSSVAIEYEQSQGFQNVSRNTGGLRIQKIINSDGVDPLKNIEKSFLYESPLIAVPVDMNKLYFTVTEESICNANDIHQHYTKVVRNSSTKFSLGSVKGGPVGYAKVTTFYGPPGSTGKTESEFTNENDYGLDIAEVYPYPPADMREWRRGKLIKQTEYNSAGVKLKELTNTYDYQQLFSLTSFKAGYVHLYPAVSACNELNCPVGDCGLQKVCYNTTSEFVKMTNQTEKLYSPNGIDFVLKSTDYFYDNNVYNQANRIKTTRSDGDVVQTEYKFPYDFPLNNVNLEMVNRNQISNVVEQIQSNVSKSVELSRSKTDYQLWAGNSIIEPVSIKKSVNGASLESEIELNAYDDKGNLLQFTGKDQVVTSYIWGYSKYYPVAKIIGKSYNEAVQSSGLDLAIVTNPPNDNALRTELNKLRTLTGALVTTYTYKPLIGISSVTDANNNTVYYEYDNLSRLALIRDKDNNIVKKICYNYAGQPETCPVFNNPSAQWTATGKTRCKPCPANNNYIINMLQKEEKDVNTQSATYNTLRWTDIGLSSSCDINADWKNTTTPVRCKQNSSLQNTGEQEQEQMDMNPCSDTYGMKRWIVVGVNYTVCPLPSTGCNSTNCAGENKKCINGVCQNGVKVYTSSVYFGKRGYWLCTYHYRWNDGSVSPDYQENSPTTCLGSTVD